MANKHTAVPLPAALWSNVDTSGGPDACWPWTRKIGASGYGVLSRKGFGNAAHRIAYTLTYGPIATGMLVMHRCDNPPCCNPSHLVAGTQRENMADMATKGRSAPSDAKRHLGSTHGRAKLTEADVLIIRERASAAKRGALKQMAGEYGVTKGLISQIVNRRIWRHI